MLPLKRSWNSSKSKSWSCRCSTRLSLLSCHNSELRCRCELSTTADQSRARIHSCTFIRILYAIEE